MTFRWIWKYIKQYKFRMIFGLVLVLIASLLAMVNPYMTQWIVDRVINKGETGLLTKIIAVMIGATLFKSIIRYTFQLTFESVSQFTFKKIREDIYLKIQELDFEFFDKTRTGDIMARMTGDMEAIRHFISWVIYMVFENAAICIFAVIMLFKIDYKLAMFMLAITPVTGYFTFRLASEVKPTFSLIREQFSKLNTVVQENISGNRVVKAFAKEEYEIEKFGKENSLYKQRNIESAAVWEKFLPVIDSLAGVLTVVMILTGGVMVINETMSLGELVAFNSFIWALNNPMRMAGWLVNDIQRFSASAEKVMALLDCDPKIKNSESVIDKDRIKGTIEFRNVNFSYGDEKVLEDINFKVNPGQTIAVIGPTGAGKSTLVNLICRFYDCTKGEIFVDNIDIKDINVRKLRESISVAMQDIFLFSDTIEGNIAYGVPEASMEQVQWAATVAGAHGFISGFAEGYDTIIGERGVGLSGGQKQRIALARALLKNPSILLLDDTTSSVDLETEHEIHKTLKSFYKDKTTFIIAHRISSVKNADLILVLDDGKIMEQGTHEVLLKKKGYYHSVFINQFGDFDNSYVQEVG
jgi:ATP-binding cassette, subfamily B, multidrug efflux pump